MRKSWLIKQSKKKLELDLVVLDEKGNETRPEWIEVLTALTAGQRKKLEHSGLRKMRPAKGTKYGDKNLELEIVLEIEEAEIEKILAWVKDWSFTDFNGNLLTFSRENLCSIDVEAFEVIKKAVDDHTEEIEAGKKSRSNTISGGSRLKRISPSCEPSDGPPESITIPPSTSSNVPES